MNKYRAMKYEGDDSSSWAVFYAKDVKGMKGILFYGDAKPIVCGLRRDQTTYHMQHLKDMDKERQIKEGGTYEWGGMAVEVLTIWTDTSLVRVVSEGPEYDTVLEIDNCEIKIN